MVGPKGEITLEQACILAERHVHMNTKDLKKYQVKDNDLVQIKIDGPRSALLDAYIKSSENGVIELHLDRDEANALLLEKNAEVTVFYDV